MKYFFFLTFLSWSSEHSYFSSLLDLGPLEGGFFSRNNTPTAGRDKTGGGDVAQLAGEAHGGPGHGCLQEGGGQWQATAQGGRLTL